MQEERTQRLLKGRAALEAGEWQEAKAAFEAVLTNEGDDPLALEGLGYALWWMNDLSGSQAVHERAYVRLREMGDSTRAAAIAMWLSAIQYLAYGNAAACRGWLARAERLLETADRSIQHGWLSIYRAAASDPEAMATYAHEALEVAEEFANVDLQGLALGYGGLARVLVGQVEEGMAWLDEAMVAATAGEMRDQVAIGLVFCVTLTACHHALDLERAEQWAETADRYLTRNPQTSFFATCRTFYGSMLTATGRWDRAEQELLRALRTFEAGYQAMRIDALVRLAELRVRQGRYEEAQELLQGYEDHPQASAPLADAFLAQHRPNLALSLLERRLALLPQDSLEAAPLLALANRAWVEVEELDRAQQAADRLADMGTRSGSVAISALAECCAARVVAAKGEDALARLEAALALFSKAHMPFEVAEVRLMLARGLAENAPEVAVAEAGLALKAFERLGAARLADKAAALLRSLGVVRTGPKGRTVLTKRETEVLGLLGLGLTNEQIAERLVISRRTAEHHVSSVLAKLGMSTRAQAAAYAVRKQGEPVPPS